MDVEKLTKLVKDHKEIYDTSDVNHRNRDAISAAWKSISQILNSTAQVKVELYATDNVPYIVPDNVQDDDASFGSSPNDVSCSVMPKVEMVERMPQVEMVERVPLVGDPQPQLDGRKRNGNKRSRLSDEQYYEEVRNMSERYEEDPDRMFLLSLLPMVKRLSPVDNLDFRMEVQQLLRIKLFTQNPSCSSSDASNF